MADSSCVRLSVKRTLIVLVLGAGLGCNSSQDAKAAEARGRKMREMAEARFERGACENNALIENGKFLRMNGAHPDPDHPGWYIGPTWAIQQAATQEAAARTLCQSRYDTAIRVIQSE